MIKKNGYDLNKWVEFIPEPTYSRLSDDVLKNLLDYRTIQKIRIRKQKVIDKTKKEIEPLLKKLNKFQSEIKEYEREELRLYELIFYLKNRIEPNITIYLKNESSKSYLKKTNQLKHGYPNRTYKGKPLVKREVLYCKIKHGSSQKDIYIGNISNTIPIVERLLNKDFSKKDTRVLKNNIRILILPYIRYHLTDGMEKFMDGSHSFSKNIIHWIENNPKLWIEYS
jgi:hypothetical protein